MRGKLRVNVEDILEAKSLLTDVNRAGFDGIDLYHDGRLFEFTEEEKKEWEFIGLNITDLILEYDYPEYG